MATGFCNSTSTETLSPGITISTPCRQRQRARHIRCAEIKLRTIIREERRVTATFILGQHIDFRLELRVRRDRARLGQNHAALHFFLLRAAQQHAHVVARVRAIEQLAEHFNVRRHRLARVLQADDFNFVHLLEHAALDTTGHDRAATFNVEHVFDAHQERLVHFAHRVSGTKVSSASSKS